MNYEFDLAELKPVTLAATETFVDQAEIPLRIPGMLETLHDWLRNTGTEPDGLNHAVYDRFGPDGMRMRIGVPVAAPFAASGAIACSALGGGKAAHTRHHGPYEGLRDAHMQLNDWCAAHGLEPAGEAWEVYGEWHPHPSHLVTDVYLRIAQ